MIPTSNPPIGRKNTVHTANSPRTAPQHQDYCSHIPTSSFREDWNSPERRLNAVMIFFGLSFLVSLRLQYAWSAFSRRRE